MSPAAQSQNITSEATDNMTSQNNHDYQQMAMDSLHEASASGPLVEQ